MRARLAQALQPVSRANARLVEKPATKLDVLDTAWLSGWQVVDVTNATMAHPQRFYVALADDGRAELLTGEPAGFAAVTASGAVSVTTAGTAEAVAETYLDATRAFVAYSYRVDAITDVQWLPHPTDADAEARSRLERTYRDRVRPPEPAAAGSGWKLTQWMVDGRTLVRHDLTVDADGSVTDLAKVVEEQLPVPASV